MTVIVVGAGIAGLLCARELERGGQTVMLLERESVVGGRVRTDVVDGCTIDRGFQVLFTAYPVLGAALDLSALSLRPFRPAARLTGDPTLGSAPLFGDAIAEPSLFADTVLAGGIPLTDKLRLLALRWLATSLSVEECFGDPYQHQSTRDFLLARGLAPSTVQRFFAPFYGGIMLDRALATSASIFLFTFKMLASGQTAVPARGIGAIPAQLAAGLAPGTLRTGVAVRALDVADGRVRGVVLDSGETIAGTDVVLATDPPASARLAATAGVAIAIPAGALGATTVYFRSTAAEPPLAGTALWLNADPNAVITHAITLTEVAPEYAPRGTHLVEATAVGPAADQDEAALEAHARAAIAVMRGGESPTLERVAIVRVPYAQYPQRPGFRDRRPSIATTLPGLWMSGELLHSSSLDGAARGGRDTARAMLSRSTAARRPGS